MSFGSQQAKFAKDAIEDNLDQGEHIFETTQGLILPVLPAAHF